MFWMIFIFVLELFFAALPGYVAEITTIIARVFFPVTDEERNTREEITDLKNEQAMLSVTDDFVKYARLQRKIDKLMTGVKEEGGKRKQHITYLRMGVTAGIYVIHAMIFLILMYFLRSHPLMMFPSSWVFPFGKILAFPTGEVGGVGLGCWVLVSHSVIHRAKALMKV